MEYEDLSPELRDAFHEMLEEHLTTCLPSFLKNKRHGLLPLVSVRGVQDLQEELTRMAADQTVEALPLAVARSKEAKDAVIGLISQDGRIDVDRAYDKAIYILKNLSFERALFSYSTKAVTSDGRTVDAVKTILIDKSGTALIVFTPCIYTGFLKKKVEFQNHVFGGAIENIFDGENHN